MDGQANLVEDIIGCETDNELKTLADSIDTGLLRPLKATAGKTPVIVQSPALELRTPLTIWMQ